MEYHVEMRKVLLLPALCLLFAPLAHAGVPMITTGDDIRLDVASFPPHLKEQVQLVNTRCTKCHSLWRVIEAIDSGRTTSGAPFDKYYVRSLIIKKKRHPAASLSSEEAKAILQLFGYIQDNPGQYARK